MNDSFIGRTLGNKYTIIEQIGIGGMAAVYRARQKDSDEHVAVKVMHTFLVTEKDFLQRFKREARVMATLAHHRIVPLYDFDFCGPDIYYLVMKYIGGGTLKEKLEKLLAHGQRLPIAQTRQIAIEVCDALAYAHFHDIVHRDIKSGNIMLDSDDRAILTDFGIVKMLGGASAYTVTGALIGTPDYIAPEQALGRPGDKRSDIYSLGVLLFQIATGKLPYEADTPLAVVLKHVNEPPPLPITFNPDVPLDLQAVILKAMAKDPAQRYHSAADMLQALQNADLTTTAAKLRAMVVPLAVTTDTTIATEKLDPPTLEQPAPAARPTVQRVACPLCLTLVDVYDRAQELTCSACAGRFPLARQLCPYCRTYHAAAVAFCQNCGEGMVRTCHHCLAVSWAGHEHCQHCGRPLDLFEILKTRTKQATVERLQKQMEMARQLKRREREASNRRLAEMALDEGKWLQELRLYRQAQATQVLLWLLLALAGTLVLYLLITGLSWQ